MRAEFPLLETCVYLNSNSAGATPRARDRRGGIVALRFPGDAAVARELVESGFICSYRGGLRIAPHFYNIDEEIDRFMDELVLRVREAA